MSESGQRSLLATLGIAPASRARLSRAGFITAADVLELQPSDLATELDISAEESLDILESVRSATSSCDASNDSKTKQTNDVKKKNDTTAAPSENALDVLHRERNRRQIVTFCREWDNLLGGGVCITRMTEFCGAPGVGKTQLGIQLCLNVQIPPEHGGIGGEAIYIDTEGSFVVERVCDMAEALESHLKSLRRTDFTASDSCETTDVSAMLDKIHYFRVHDYVEQLAVIQVLEDRLAENKRIKLIVIDSIAFHFRGDFADMVLRTRLLNGMAQNLLRLATTHELAVVIMNQMTTKRTGSGSHTESSAQSSGASQLIPALGETWGHASTVRCIMYWDDGRRMAHLYKSPSEREGTVEYVVTRVGIRSAPPPAGNEGEEPMVDLQTDRKRTHSMMGA
eukprot:m.103996 g.103996  ORF g.103996 m.103996 type:complete len:396 (+) comp16843_c0_seq12:131-1318(+)